MASKAKSMSRQQELYDAGSLRIPGLMIFWFVVSTLICFWDAGFVLLRPHSMKGGNWHWLYTPYELYITIDKLYGDMNNGFVRAQSWLNLFEGICVLLGLCLYFTHDKLKSVNNTGVVILFATSWLTWGKTVVYTLNDASISILLSMYTAMDFMYTGHNDLKDLLLLYLLPNGFWLVIPLLCTLYLGRKLAYVANNVAQLQLEKYAKAQ